MPRWPYSRDAPASEGALDAANWVAGNATAIAVTIAMVAKRPAIAVAIPTVAFDEAGRKVWASQAVSRQAGSLSSARARST